MLSFGRVDAGWKPGGSRIGEKTSLLSDDSTVSASEDMSTTTGSKEVTCMRRAYANSLQIGVASMIQPFRPFVQHLRWGVAQHHSCLLLWCEGCEGGEVK